MKLADHGITTEPRGLTASQSRLVDFFTTAAVLGRSAALDVCVASGTAAAARGENSRTPETKSWNCDSRAFCRPPVWAADGRPHPAVTRTLQNAADIASSRNGQQTSAKSHHHRWKHEIQIALLRQRAAMARAVLLNPSARTEWLLAGVIDRAVHHWDMSLLLTVDLATTTMPTPRLTQQYLTITTTSRLSPIVRSSLCSHQVSNRLVPHPFGAVRFWLAMGFSKRFRK